MAPKPRAETVAAVTTPDTEPVTVEAVPFFDRGSVLDRYHTLAANITSAEPAPSVDEVVEEPLPLVVARYVGIEPVLSVVDGAQVIVQPGDPIPVTTEQLEQNPIFEVWED